MDSSGKKEPFFTDADIICKGYILISHDITWFRTTMFAFTIVLMSMNEEGVPGCIGAVVLHGVACAVTTLVVFWNNPESIHSFTQGCKFWFMNLLFVSTKLPSRIQKSENFENRDYLWYRHNYFNLCIFNLTSNEDSMQLESKLKEMYARLCVCFFTLIPSAFLQSHFLFQSEAWLNAYFQLLFVVRVVFITATAFESAITVTLYEKYCHEFTVQMCKIDKQARPKGSSSKPEMFWPPRLLGLEFFTIIQWLLTSTYLLEFSGSFMSAYMLFMFLQNYVILKLIPEIEKSFVNPPYGFHTAASFWTTRIINSTFSVGTRLHQNSLGLVNRLGGWSFTRTSILAYHQLQLLTIPIIIFPDLYLLSMICFREKMVILFFWGLRMFTYYVSVGDEIDEGPLGTEEEGRIDEDPVGIEEDREGIEEDDEEYVRCCDDCPSCEDHYPVLPGYSFYDMLFEHAFEHSMNKLETLRTLMVTSLTVPMNYRFYKHYCELLNDRELTLQRLRDEIIRDYSLQDQLDLSLGELIHEIYPIMRNRKLEEGFPFVSEFDDFMRTILENADEEEKIKDLKLFYTFYQYFDCIVHHLQSDKILKISKIMGVEVRKWNDGNQVWGLDIFCKLISICDEYFMN